MKADKLVLIGVAAWVCFGMVHWGMAPANAELGRLMTQATAEVAISSPTSGRVAISTFQADRVDNASEYGLMSGRVYVRLCNYNGNGNKVYFGFDQSLSTQPANAKLVEYINDGDCKNINVLDTIPVYAMVEAQVDASTGVVTQGK